MTNAHWASCRMLHAGPLLQSEPRQAKLALLFLVDKHLKPREGDGLAYGHTAGAVTWGFERVPIWQQNRWPLSNIEDR